MYTNYEDVILIKTRMKWILYALNFLAFFSISMINTQMIPYLSDLGYSVVERGYILAGMAVIAILGQFLFGYLCDRFHRIKIFFFLAFVLLTGSSFAIFLVSKQSFWYHLCSVSIMGGMVKVIMGLDETWMMKIDEENYGKLRASGALGLTVGSPIAGFVIKSFSYYVLLGVFSIVSIILCVVIWRAQDAQQKEKSITLSCIVDLVKNKGYMMLIIIYLCVYMIGTADQYVVIDKMLDIGGTTTSVGIKWALQSFMEVPLFLYSSKILEKFSLKTLLYTGTICYGIKFLFYGLSSTPFFIIVTAALQLVTLPIIMLTSKILIKEITPESVFNSAQMFAMAIFIGVSGLITPLITSHLSELFGYNVTLYIIASFTIVPLLLIYLYMKYFNQEEKS